ncbi:Actin-related protein 2/3 complex subunitA [Sesamum angolense]|uniref:Actin-related protein 2/3 complex subunitA n=1 Tax=Sesamum angolense TaxID=2727404 RepID=A0AAE1WRG8_9LAMI|nr:Actin-related protein 2/3 complex subunitA [Sesamum angolense]
MAAVSIHQFVQCITCHAWSPDHSMIAFCPNNNEVHIYKLLEGKWEKIHVLQKHDQIVSGVDWGTESNRIVTVSHDRNSSFLRFLDEKITSSSAKSGAQLSGKFGKFYGQSKYGSNDTNETSRTHGRAHENCITNIVPLKEPGILLLHDSALQSYGNYNHKMTSRSTYEDEVSSNYVNEEGIPLKLKDFGLLLMMPNSVLFE